MQATTPTGREPREEPGLFPIGSVTGTLLLPRSTVARNLQPDILDQVSPERGAAGLLDVEEHYHIISFDFKIQAPLQVPDGEIVFLHVMWIRSREEIRIVFQHVPVRRAEVHHPRSHVLIQNQHEQN